MGLVMVEEYEGEGLMNIAVVYSSRTGNTKEVGGAIAKALGADLYSLDQNPDLSAYDKIAVGYWVDRANADAAARNFMEGLEGKQVFLFGTLGAYPESEHGQRALATAQSHIGPSNTVLGHFLCQGKIDQAIVERFKNMPTTSKNPHAPSPERIQLWAAGAGHPNQDDLDRAVAAARQAFGL